MTTKEHMQIISAVANDPWIKVAGIDADGILRGKDIAHSKFVKATEASAKGFAMCSIVFGWDMTDEVCT
jgi:glutamine synthetase